MTNPLSSKAPILLLALIALLGLTATMAVATCGLEQSSAAMPASSTSASMSSSNEMAMSAASMGSGMVSSLNENAFLIKGDLTSENVTSVHGVIGFGVRDLSAAGVSPTKDAIEYGLARIHDPSDDSAYEIRFTGVDKSADVKFGGVAFFQPVFGSTGIGEAKLPQTVAYVAAWGVADILKNGKRIAQGVPAHLVVTPGIRDASGKLLTADSIDLSARDIMLHVPGPVTGLPDGMLVAFWPSAALDLSDVGGRPLSRIAIAQAPVSGLPLTTKVLGEAAMVVPQHVQFSLKSNGFISYIPATFSTGYTKITVVNNSPNLRGAIIRARDIAGNQLIRYTPLLRPGKAFSFYTHIGSGSFNVMEYHGGIMKGMRHWRSGYQTSFTVAK